MSYQNRLYLKPLQAHASAAPDTEEDSSADCIKVKVTSKGIEGFVNSANRPLRLKVDKATNAPIYLRELSVWEHLKERLGFFLYNNKARRQRAHEAIERCVRPLIMNSKAAQAKKEWMLAQLHERVEQRTLRGKAVSFPGIQPGKASGESQEKKLAQSRATMFSGRICMPAGVSIAYAKPAKIIADAKIVDAGSNLPKPKGQRLSTVVMEHGDFFFNQLDNTSSSDVKKAFSDYYKKQFENMPSQAHTIVLQLKGNTKEDWEGAYSAAQEHADGGGSGAKRSIMLVPPSTDYAALGKSREAAKKAVESKLQKIMSCLVTPANGRAINHSGQKNNSDSHSNSAIVKKISPRRVGLKGRRAS